MPSACKVQCASTFLVIYSYRGPRLGWWLTLHICTTFMRLIGQCVYPTEGELFVRLRCWGPAKIREEKKKVFRWLSPSWLLCWVYRSKSNNSPLSSLQPNGFRCLRQTLGKFFCTHRGVAVLLFVFYWVYRSLFQSNALSFSLCLSCLVLPCS